jgi:hypothetical protein
MHKNLERNESQPSMPSVRQTSARDQEVSKVGPGMVGTASSNFRNLDRDAEKTG